MKRKLVEKKVREGVALTSAMLAVALCPPAVTQADSAFIVSGRLIDQPLRDYPVDGKMPNLILIVPDDQGYGDIGAYPSKYPVETPNIDRLAHEGVMMTDAYANSPICGPSRAALMTGRYQQRIGYYGNWESQLGLARDTPILPRLLRDHGYTSALVGKWHLGHHVHNHPLALGFDFSFGFLDGQHDYFDPDRGSSWSWGPHGLSFTEHNTIRVDEIEYMTDEFNNRAIEFMEKNKQHPFFLYLAYNAPHSPLQAATEDLLRFAHRDDLTLDRMNLLAMVEAMDRGVGMILDFLHENDLDDNTLIFYYNDNGGLDETNTGFDNWIYNGSKGFLSEGGIRVPALARWPGVLPAGLVYEEPILHIDVLPTFLAAGGIEIPGDVEGANLLPHWRGEAHDPPHQTLHWSMVHDLGRRWAIREGDWKLVDARNVQGLFNLREDPGEANDLSSAHPEIVDRLTQRQNEWNEENLPSPVTRENFLPDTSELFFRHEFRGPSRNTRQILEELINQ